MGAARAAITSKRRFFPTCYGAEWGSVFGFRITLRKEGPDIEGLRGRFGYRRVLLCDPNAKSREVMIKHMMALGLRPEAVDACDEQTLSGLGPDDLVILCEDRGINGTVRIGSGPNFITDAQTVPRPLLRDAMLQALTDATRRSVRPSGTGERRAAHRAEILSLRPAEPSNFSPTYPTISF